MIQLNLAIPDPRVTEIRQQWKLETSPDIFLFFLCKIKSLLPDPAVMETPAITDRLISPSSDNLPPVMESCQHRTIKPPKKTKGDWIERSINRKNKAESLKSRAFDRLTKRLVD